DLPGGTFDMAVRLPDLCILYILPACDTHSDRMGGTEELLARDVQFAILDQFRHHCSLRADRRAAADRPRTGIGASAQGRHAWTRDLRLAVSHSDDDRAHRGRLFLEPVPQSHI